MERPRPPEGYETDPDFDHNPSWTAADFARARPSEHVLSPDIVALFTRKPGRPAMAPHERKQKVNIRLSPDVLAALRAGGPGWQRRADAILRQGLGLAARGA